MQELELGPNVRLLDHPINIPLSEAQIERMSGDPVEMCVHSYRIQGRLPDRLHDAMLLWSFDPVAGYHVQSYLEWVKHCDNMNEERNKLARMMIMHDRILFTGMIVSGLTLAILLIFGLK